MTIAMCYVSPEGIVLGADSTASVSVPPGGFHFFNHAQKLFEIGENSTLAALVWGLGGLPLSSHRTLFASLADDLAAKGPTDVGDVAQRWTSLFWKAYSTELAASIARCAVLNGQAPFNLVAPVPGGRSEMEEKEFQQLRMGLVVGFCLAGYVLPNRSPAALTVIFDPLQGMPTPDPIVGAGFWGAPNMIQRLIFGSDPGLRGDIVASGKWTGTPAELDAVMGKHTLFHPMLPIRDAIDFVHTCIYSTIKAFKFSNLSQICGGPIEIAVIRTDRKFTWVRHKEWDAALAEGALE